MILKMIFRTTKSFSKWNWTTWSWSIYIKKWKQDLSLNKNIEQRLMALEDISNRLVNEKYIHNRRERSNSNEKRSKRRRKYQINDDYSDSS